MVHMNRPQVLALSISHFWAHRKRKLPPHACAVGIVMFSRLVGAGAPGVREAGVKQKWESEVKISNSTAGIWAMYYKKRGMNSWGEEEAS